MTALLTNASATWRSTVTLRVRSRTPSPVLAGAEVAVLHRTTEARSGFLNDRQWEPGRGLGELDLLRQTMATRVSASPAARTTPYTHSRPRAVSVRLATACARDFAHRLPAGSAPLRLTHHRRGRGHLSLMADRPKSARNPGSRSHPRQGQRCRPVRNG